MGQCPILPSQGMEAAWWDHCSLQQLGRCFWMDFNRSQLSRERGRCIILHWVWHFPSVCLCVQLPRETEEFIFCPNTPTKEAKADMDPGVCDKGKLLCCVANCEPMASLRHIHSCKCSITISIWESHCHYLMLFQGLLLYQQQEGINSASFPRYCLLGKLCRENMLCASVTMRVRRRGKRELLFSGKE